MSLNGYANYVGYQRATINDKFVDSNGLGLPAGTTFVDAYNTSSLCLQFLNTYFYTTPCVGIQTFALCKCLLLCKYIVFRKESYIKKTSDKTSGR